MKKIAFLSTAIAAVLLVGSPAAKAVNLDLSAVTPLDTYSFDLIGFNQTAGASSALYLASGNARFGLSSTVTGPDGQVITITSSETVGITTTTDTFTISTPTNFITDTSLGGNVIDGILFDVGNSNTPAPDSVSVVFPITSFTNTGTVTFTGTLGATTASLTPTPMVAANGLSYGFDEGIHSSLANQAISGAAVRAFSYSISYPTIVPEPSTWALLGLGMITGAVVVRRRKLAA